LSRYVQAARDAADADKARAEASRDAVLADTERAKEELATSKGMSAAAEVETRELRTSLVNAEQRAVVLQADSRAAKVERCGLSP